ncbi:alpha-L-fucosidase [Ruminococcaceae bacterium OttesenSCG-928-I18]|nr:alpha-L-fucosidase [Ruminococcaceae bacterium OttesenSCG-928-I18]
MWIEQSRRRLFLDMHFPDWPQRQTATHFEPERIARAVRDARFDSVVLFAKCQYGNFYYDTRLGHKHSGLGEQDFFRETAAHLQKEGIQVIAYYSVAWDEWQAKENAHWRVQQADGTTGTDEFRWSTLCLNTPYRQVVKAQLAEIASELHPDGIWVDMTIIGKDACFCPACREKYEERYGEELALPPKAGRARNRFLQFRYDYIEQFYSEIYTLIHEIDPSIQVTNNYWGYPYSSYTMGSRAVGALRCADYVTGEAYTDWTGLSAPGFFPKWLRSVADNRPYEALIGRFIGTWDYTVKPPLQLALECYTAAINGACVTLDDEPFADGGLDWPLYREMGEIFGEIEKRQEWLQGTPLRHGAVFHSQLTKDYYLEEEAFIASIAGAYRMMKEIQSPCEFLFDDALTPEKLRRYRFVFLPQVAVMEPKTAALLLEYVNEGGILVASGETAAYTVRDETPARTNRFEEAFGYRCEGRGDYTITYLLLTDPTLQKAAGERPVTVRSPYIKVKTAGGKALAHVTDPICETTKEHFFHNNLPAPYSQTDFPALLELPYGKGKMYLFTQDVFGQFARYHQVELKHLLQALLAREKRSSPIRFGCSSNVETSVWQQGHSWFVHLVNIAPGMTLCTGNMDSFEARYPRTFEYVDSVPVLHDLAIEVDRPGLKGARQLPDGEPLPIRETETGSVITLPRLTTWATVELLWKERG